MKEYICNICGKPKTPLRDHIHKPTETEPPIELELNYETLAFYFEAMLPEVGALTYLHMAKAIAKSAKAHQDKAVKAALASEFKGVAICPHPERGSMSNYLYILDAGDCWAIADDTPEVRVMLAEISELWENQTNPVTVNEIDSPIKRKGE